MEKIKKIKTLAMFVLALGFSLTAWSQVAVPEAEAVSFEPKVDYSVVKGKTISADDLNGDGHTDIIAGISGGFFSVLINKGDGSGTFNPGIDYGGGIAVGPFGMGDFDGDGNVDLVDKGLRIFSGDGNGAFSFFQDFPEIGLVQSLSSGDIDLDDDIDIVSAIDKHIVVYENNGSGNFGAGVIYAAEPNTNVITGVAIGNLNLGIDSFPDIVAVNSWSPFGNYMAQVFLNKGDGSGTFNSVVGYSTGDNPQDVALGDFDFDGNIDISAGFYPKNGVSVLLNNGNGTFAPRNNYSVDIGGSSSLAINDFDLDGDIDIASANRSGDTVSILPNNGNGIFGANQDFGVGTSPRSIASSDFNADGKPDIAVINENDATVSILLNNTPDTASPTITTEAWIPDDATGTYIPDGGVVILEDIDEAGENLTIYSNASDASGIQDHKITYWRSDSAGNPISSGTTTWFTGGLHSIIINGPLNDGDVIEYQSEATDNAVPSNTGYDPADGVTRYSFRVAKPLEITINLPADGTSYAHGDLVTISGTAKSNLYIFPPFSDGYTSFTDFLNPEITDGINTVVFIGDGLFTKTAQYTGDITGSFNFPAGFSGPVTLIVYIQGTRLSDGTIDTAIDTVDLIANTPPTVTNADSASSVDDCGVGLPGSVLLSWNFNDTEDGTTQTAYEIELTRSDTDTCVPGKQTTSSTFIAGASINSFCPNFIDYGGYTYDWDIKVYDSAGADSGFVAGASFFSTPTSSHRYPTAKFSYSADDDPPLQFHEITFDPLTPPDNSEVYGGASIVSFEWNFDDGTTPNPISDPLVDGGVVVHSYSDEGAFIVNLKVTDSDGYACWASQNMPANTKKIDIGVSKPEWKEVEI